MSARKPRLSLSKFVQSLLAVAAFVLPGHMALGQANDLMWGANGHPFTAYPGVSYIKQLDLVKDLGMKSYRVNVSSIDSLRGLADLAALGRERGVSILPVLTPGLDVKTESPEALYAKAFNFAFSLAAPLKHAITTWELGNELETYAILQPCEMQDDGKQYPCSNGPASGVTALEYHGGRWKKVSAVLRGMADGIIAVDPTLKKAIGTAGWGHIGAFDRMESDGVKWDISVWHTYQNDPLWVIERVAQFKRPIWITEFNHPRGSEGGLAAQADGVKVAMDRIRQWRSRFNIEAAFFYELLDEPYWAPEFEAVMGLVGMDKLDGGAGWAPGEPKPAYHVVKAEIAKGMRLVNRSCVLDALKVPTATAQQQVAYAYCLILGREPDGQGQLDWSAKLSSGLAMPAFLMATVDSDEFANRYLRQALSDREFVVLVFEMLLGRKPDGGGLQSYLTELGRKTMRRRDVIEGIVTSHEFRVHHALLFSPGRSADGNSGSALKQ